VQNGLHFSCVKEYFFSDYDIFHSIVGVLRSYLFYS
jgi:hypothetical protein